MRWLILCLFGLISCKSQHQINLKLTPEVSISAPLPTKAITNAVLIPNVELLLKADEFGNDYLELVPSDKLVFKLQYLREQLPNTADSQYEEVVYVELTPPLTEVHLSGNQLAQVKMTFGRFCYCKGTSGYFRVSQGNLSVVPQGKTLHITAAFQVDGIPQEMDALKVSFHYN